MPRQTSIAVIGEGEALLTSLGDNPADFQHMEGSRQELQGLVDQAKVLAKEQAAFTATKQDTSKRLSAVLKQIRSLLNLLRIAIKQHYGNDSEKLVEFRLQPFRSRRAARPVPETPTPPPPLPE
jgi:hypothetical protein